MEEAEQYVGMMIDSLRKKDGILEEIIIQNDIQSNLAAESELDMEAFGKSVEAKQKLIEQLNVLDDGFEALYNKIKDDLVTRKAHYASEIHQMQQLIKSLSEKGIKIQAQEEKNRLSLTTHFSKMKKEVKVTKKSMQVASDYYKNMSKTSVVDSQFMDKKK